jgi:hypothetical protein
MDILVVRLIHIFIIVLLSVSIRVVSVVFICNEATSC